MKIIVGLGNPERRYERTRHNAGFLAVDRLVGRHAGGERVRARFNADGVEAEIRGERCLLLKPTTYMNRSGQCVGEACRFYKIDAGSDLLVMTDDLALPMGMIRLRARGGDGGHNGLADITRVLGSNGYCRCRVGIDPKPAFMDQASYVLARLTDDDMARLDPGLERAADAAEVFISEGIEPAMNRFNERVAGARQDEHKDDVHPGWLDGPGEDAHG